MGADHVRHMVTIGRAAIRSESGVMPESDWGYRAMKRFLDGRYARPLLAGAAGLALLGGLAAFGDAFAQKLIFRTQLPGTETTAPTGGGGGEPAVAVFPSLNASGAAFCAGGTPTLLSREGVWSNEGWELSGVTLETVSHPTLTLSDFPSANVRLTVSGSPIASGTEIPASSTIQIQATPSTAITGGNLLTITGYYTVYHAATDTSARSPLWTITANGQSGFSLTDTDAGQTYSQGTSTSPISGGTIDMSPSVAVFDISSPAAPRFTVQPCDGVDVYLYATLNLTSQARAQPASDPTIGVDATLALDVTLDSPGPAGANPASVAPTSILTVPGSQTTNLLTLRALSLLPDTSSPCPDPDAAFCEADNLGIIERDMIWTVQIWQDGGNTPGDTSDDVQIWNAQVDYGDFAASCAALDGVLASAGLGGVVDGGRYTLSPPHPTVPYIDPMPPLDNVECTQSGGQWLTWLWSFETSGLGAHTMGANETYVIENTLPGGTAAEQNELIYWCFNGGDPANGLPSPALAPGLAQPTFVGPTDCDSTSAQTVHVFYPALFGGDFGSNAAGGLKDALTPVGAGPIANPPSSFPGSASYRTEISGPAGYTPPPGAPGGGVNDLAWGGFVNRGGFPRHYDTQLMYHDIGGRIGTGNCANLAISTTPVTRGGATFGLELATFVCDGRVDPGNP